MALLLALIMALIPLAIAPGWFFYFDVTPKIVLLLLGTAAAAVWWAAGTGGASLYRASREARWFVLALGGMAVSLTVSTLLSVNPALSLGGSNWRHWGLVTQLAALAFAALAAAGCAGRPDRLRVMLRAISVSGLASSVYGIAQYFGWDPLLDARGYHAGEGVYTIVRPPATLGHADYFANWLVLAVFAGAATAVSEQQARWRRLGWTAAGVSSVAMILSGTRAAMLGCLAGAVLLMLWRGIHVTRRAVVAALAIVAGAAIFYFSPAGAMLRARVHWALEEPAGGARLLLWRDSLRMAASRWPAGYGPETFIPSFALHQSRDLSRAYPDFYHESPHNIFIDGLVSQGLGGCVLLALVAVGLAAAWRERRNPAAGALAAALVAMTISEQFACFTLPTALAYYAAVAMLVSLTVPVVRAILPAAGFLAGGTRLWRMAVVVPCAGTLVFFGVRLCMAETLLNATSRDLDAGQLSAAANHYAEYQKWRWPGAGADLWYSRRLAQIAGSHAERVTRVQAFHQAGLAAQRATRTTEAKFNAYYNLAAFYARQNDFARTEQCLRAAISYAPNWFKTHWMLAQVLEAGSRLGEAAAEAATAAALDGGKHPEVTGTLEHIQVKLKTKTVESTHE